jgi:hypothetical protein
MDKFKANDLVSVLDEDHKKVSGHVICKTTWGHYVVRTDCGRVIKKFYTETDLQPVAG